MAKNQATFYNYNYFHFREFVNGIIFIEWKLKLSILRALIDKITDFSRKSLCTDPHFLLKTCRTESDFLNFIVISVIFYLLMRNIFN